MTMTYWMDKGFARSQDDLSFTPPWAINPNRQRRQGKRPLPKPGKVLCGLADLVKQQARSAEVAVTGTVQCGGSQPVAVSAEAREAVGEHRLPIIVAAFQRALELDPRVPEANGSLGVLYLERGQLDEAEEHSLAAIENFRLTGKRLYESYALSRLSSIHRRRGMYDEAEDAALRAKVVREELRDRRGKVLASAEFVH